MGRLRCVMPATRACRDFGPRGDRQKTRLMWLVEAMGVEAFPGKDWRVHGRRQAARRR